MTWHPCTIPSFPRCHLSLGSTTRTTNNSSCLSRAWGKKTSYIILLNSFFNSLMTHISKKRPHATLTNKTLPIEAPGSLQKWHCLFELFQSHVFVTLLEGTKKHWDGILNDPRFNGEPGCCVDNRWDYILQNQWWKQRRRSSGKHLIECTSPHLFLSNVALQLLATGFEWGVTTW